MHIDCRKGRTTAELLYKAFRSEGIHGQKAMPGDLMPEGMARGSREHLLFITLTTAINDQRDSFELWKNSCLTYDNPKTRYLFEPAELSRVPFNRIIRDLHRYRLSRNPIKDAQIWVTITTTFLQKYDDDPTNLLLSCDYKADRILQELLEGRHGRGRKKKPDFPNLGGPTMAPLWMGMLRENLDCPLVNMEKIPLPADIHVAAATLTLGVVKGRYEGPLEQLFHSIGEAWSRSLEGVLRPDGLPMIALDLAEPLRHLFRRGCSTREADGTCTERENCPCRDHCSTGFIEMDRAKDMVRFAIG